MADVHYRKVGSKEVQVTTAEKFTAMQKKHPKSFERVPAPSLKAAQPRPAATTGEAGRRPDQGGEEQTATGTGEKPEENGSRSRGGRNRSN